MRLSQQEPPPKSGIIAIFIIYNCMFLKINALTQPVVELVEWRTAESDVSGSNPRARFLLKEQK